MQFLEKGLSGLETAVHKVDALAAKVAVEADSHGIEAHRHLDSIKALLDRLEPDYRD